jgi:ABC-type amino acid transport substrate-binding protein
MVAVDFSKFFLMNKHSFHPLFLAGAFALAFALSSCQESKDKTAAPAATPATPAAASIQSVQDAEGKIVGSLDAPIPKEMQADSGWFRKLFGFTPSKVVEFPTLNESIAALLAGRVDIAVPMTVMAANFYAKQNPALKAIPIKSMPIGFSMGAKSADTALVAQIDSALKALEADGTMAKLKGRYLEGDSIAVLPPQESEVGSGRELVMAVGGSAPPFDYVSPDGQPAGYNVELTKAVAQKIGAKVKFVAFSEPSILSALLSGRVDLVFLIANGGKGSPLPEGIIGTERYAADLPVAMLVRK